MNWNIDWVRLYVLVQCGCNEFYFCNQVWCIINCSCKDELDDKAHFLSCCDSEHSQSGIVVLCQYFNYRITISPYDLIIYLCDFTWPKCLSNERFTNLFNTNGLWCLYNISIAMSQQKHVRHIQSFDVDCMNDWLQSKRLIVGVGTLQPIFLAIYIHDESYLYNYKRYTLYISTYVYMYIKINIF